MRVFLLLVWCSFAHTGLFCACFSFSLFLSRSAFFSFLFLSFSRRGLTCMCWRLGRCPVSLWPSAIRAGGSACPRLFSDDVTGGDTARLFVGCDSHSCFGPWHVGYFVLVFNLRVGRIGGVAWSSLNGAFVRFVWLLVDVSLVDKFAEALSCGCASRSGARRVYCALFFLLSL